MLYRHRGHLTEKQRCRLSARYAVGPTKVAAIKDYVSLLAPHRRIAALLALIKDEPSEVFWPAFVGNWPDCDKGSTYPLLPEVLRQFGPAPVSVYLDDWDKGDFFRSLPDQITVHRGATRARIAGLSWTTRPTVAWRFARGTPDPVVATGTINKSNIWWATAWRNEEEILGTPRDIKIEVFPSQQYIAYMGSRLVDSILINRHHHTWTAKDYAFVGLKNVKPLTIARAHFLAVDRIGYTPEQEVWVGKRADPPIDTKYWAAVLAAVPAAKLERDGARFIAWQKSIEQDAAADAYWASMDDDTFAHYRYQYEKND